MSPCANADSALLFYKTPRISHGTKQQLTAEFQNNLAGTVRCNVMQQGDALALLQALPAACSKLVFFNPQYRGWLDKLAYGNEGARQKKRAKLPAMTGVQRAYVLTILPPVTALTVRPPQRAIAQRFSAVARLRHATGSVGCPFPGEDRK